jgi:hypothetical protein
MKSNMVETKNEVEVLYSSEDAMKAKVDLLAAIMGGTNIGDSCSVGTFSESTFHQFTDIA